MERCRPRCLPKPKDGEYCRLHHLRRFAVQTVLLYLAALGAGVSVATQQVLNGGLRTALQSPAWAGFFSYLGGLATMIVVLVVLREQVPSWKLVTCDAMVGMERRHSGWRVHPAGDPAAATRWGRLRCWRWSSPARCAAAVMMDHFGVFGLETHQPISMSRLDRRRAGDRAVSCLSRLEMADLMPLEILHLTLVLLGRPRAIGRCPDCAACRSSGLTLRGIEPVFA